MQLLPMASTPDGLISARDAVITKTPGREVLTTTRNVNVTQGHGWVGGLGGGMGVDQSTTPGNVSDSDIVAPMVLLIRSSVAVSVRVVSILVASFCGSVGPIMGVGGRVAGATPDIAPQTECAINRQHPPCPSSRARHGGIARAPRKTRTLLSCGAPAQPSPPSQAARAPRTS